MTTSLAASQHQAPSVGVPWDNPISPGADNTGGGGGDVSVPFHHVRNGASVARPTSSHLLLLLLFLLLFMSLFLFLFLLLFLLFLFLF